MAEALSTRAGEHVAGDVFTRVDRYIAERFSRDDEALRGVASSLERAGVRDISVSSTQGKLLHLLARLSGASRILEIGTLGGYSTIWLARALGAGGRLVTVEYSPEHARIARSNIERAGLGDLVEIRVGKATVVLKALHDERPEPFDFVFIDADKPPYEEYYRLALKLTRPGSLIVADNVIRQGQVIEPGGDESVRGVRRFLETLAADRSVSATVLQTVGAKGHDGLAIAVVGEA